MAPTWCCTTKSQNYMTTHALLKKAFKGNDHKMLRGVSHTLTHPTGAMFQHRVITTSLRLKQVLEDHKWGGTHFKPSMLQRVTTQNWSAEGCEHGLTEQYGMFSESFWGILVLVFFTTTLFRIFKFIFPASYCFSHHTFNMQLANLLLVLHSPSKMNYADITSSRFKTAICKYPRHKLTSLRSFSMTKSWK